ncbi:hypothetical protein [Luteolibacter luteus]|uniref:HEAT repeat domain-containing protein n=1 Tax=Luteolibacter luteus TaxID=2728835 RepID=A0A858RMU1_9BACT|nr:hypothetical protein [Luteolibacter luteus]QJE98716.1 hypothetical protein HHL09_24015 [Luteolibacter luteus]
MPGKPLLAILLCASGFAAWRWHDSASMRQPASSSGSKTHHQNQATDLTKASHRPPPTAASLEKLQADALAALQSSDNGERRLALETLLPDLIARDLPGTAELVKGLEPWAASEEATALLLDRWTESAPAAAADWCAQLDPAQRTRWLTRVSDQLSPRDPSAAMALLDEHQLASDPIASGTVLYHWARRDIDAACTWASHQADETFRNASWSRIAMSLAETHPARAATLAAEKITDPIQQEEAVISVLHQWILRDRPAAAAWVALFPEDSLRQRAEAEFSHPHETSHPPLTVD